MAVIQRLPDCETVTKVDPLLAFGQRPPPELDPCTGVPKKLYRLKVHEDPPILATPYFMSAAEAKHIIDLAEGQWVPSLVRRMEASSGKDQQERGQVGSAESGASMSTQAPTRTSSSCSLRPGQTEVVRELELRLAALTGLPVSTLERLSVVKYKEGEYFKRHHDGSYRPRTVFVYLNDLPEGAEGGDTFFPVLGLSVVPRAGCAVMWWNCDSDGKLDSRVVHEGRAPSAGVKYGINCFFNDQERRHVRRPSMNVGWEDATWLPPLCELSCGQARGTSSKEQKGEIPEDRTSESIAEKKHPEKIHTEDT